MTAATIRAVAPGSPAAQAGVRVNDVLDRVNGAVVRFENAFHAFKFFAQFAPGEQIVFTLTKEDVGSREVTVTVAKMPPEQDAQWKEAYMSLKRRYEK